MMAENKKENPVVGLLPMGLAETNNHARSDNQRCFLQTLQKAIIVVFFIVFTLAVYILILKFLQVDDNTYRAEIIVVSEMQDQSNLTLIPDGIEIFYKLKNQTKNVSGVRRKRDVSNVKNIKQKKENVSFNDNRIQKAWKIIADYKALCNAKDVTDNCKDIFNQLKVLTEQNVSGESTKSNTKVSSIDNIRKAKNSKFKKFGNNDFVTAGLTKRETTKSETNFGDTASRIPSQINNNMNGLYNPTNILAYPEDSSQRFADNCLLARLLRQNNPNLFGYQGLNSAFENVPSYPRSIPASFLPSYGQGREGDLHTHKLHPQDYEIARNIMSNSELKSKDGTNQQVRTVECPTGSVSCDNGETCINEKLWCDGNVDCEDISDESRCSCKSRVDKSRICDGYFDCPFGEDEMGCYGCSEDTFSCEDLDARSRGSCFTKEQRCNNIVNCANHKDETDCTMLAPSLHKKPLFSVSNTEGYLYRNFKGNWYAVCNNPYMWAHDACRRETGLIIRPPYIQALQIDPSLKVNYLNTAPGGLIHTTDSCLNSSAVYVTCPDLLCGTRILTSSQLLRENTDIENQLFGRNKRFLIHNHPLYPFIYFRNRVKRESKPLNTMYDSDEDGERGRKGEGRVVGGKPSQPAAWPWVVALYRNGMFHCGGVILNQNWIMTAAHCVQKFWQHYYEVQVGMLRRFSFSPQEQNHRVTHVIVNQNYDQEDMKNDLSLLRVKPGIQFSRWVRPICLPGPEVAGSDWKWGPKQGTMCTAVGWGATIEHGPDPDHMREVEVPVWDHCKHREDENGKEICAGLVEGGKDACQGDSGGPLLCRNPANPQQWYVAGIVSHGDGCARKGEPGVYTRVSLFIQWIKFHTSSKTLPMIQPKQDCPGFRCDSGISKCLPKKRMCDKIIDCLDGEDEINCELKTSERINDESVFENPLNRDANVTSIQKNENIENLSIPNENQIKLDTTTNKTLSSNLSPTIINIENKTVDNGVIPTVPDRKENTNTKENYTHDTNLNENIHSAELPNASNSLETEEIHDSDEHVTDDSSKVTTTESNNIQTIIISPSRVPLEPMSSTADRIKNTLEDTTGNASFINPVTHEKVNSNEELSKHFDINNDKVEDEEGQNILLTTTTTSRPKNTSSIQTHMNNDKFNDDISFPGTSSPDTTNNLQVIQDKINPNTDMTDKDLVSNAIDNNIDPETNDNGFNGIHKATTIKKHKSLSEFQCRRMYQIVPFQYRCDHKADCEDGTDELDCTCTDYLTTFNRQLLCDGNFDCADGQDENDCFGCEADEFLCKRSEVCLPKKFVCDGRPQCPLGEDEQDCFALTNGREITYYIDGRPKVSLDGYITKKKNHGWHVICEDNLSLQEQEQAATHICRYLGFSAANRYLIKHINVNENNLVQLNTADNKRAKRHKYNDLESVLFSYEERNAENKRNLYMSEPEVLKESCVPNVTKTCMALYVFCDPSLYTHFSVSQELSYGRESEDDVVQQWPWVAKLLVNGQYSCSGVLVDVSWALFSNACMNISLQNRRYITVVLGSHKTLMSTPGLYEQVLKVDVIKELYSSKVILVHLQEPAEYTSQVKPMVFTGTYMAEQKKTLCVAIGQDGANNTISVFLKQTKDACDSDDMCFVKQSTADVCQLGIPEERQWAGIISCHTKQGWYPTASFIDSKGECQMSSLITATEIANLKHEIKYYEEKPLIESNNQVAVDDCDGVRCPRGSCIKMKHVCDGVNNCEDGNDESKDSCRKKYEICSKDPLHRGCECPVGQLKCRNGECVPKELFKDGQNDCADGTDEPRQTTCSDYLSRVMPSRLCDGVLHCHDRSDEDPMFCKCFAKHAYRCGKDQSSDASDFCVAIDMVCDGVPDCPNAEDESTCVALSAPQGTPPGIGEVIIRSHGVWYSKCYPGRFHTKSELESICRQLGFISGHAKQLPTSTNGHPHNNIVVDDFSDVILNNSTKIKLRNTQDPIARATLDENLTECYPVFIECV